mmetsp:Transcript_15417/g.22648  ORF Transcript_15417/g.22648 Transcript_15417/m.22648 type:complete len:210 (-) Transcript_15417:130-759(-)
MTRSSLFSKSVDGLSFCNCSKCRIRILDSSFAAGGGDSATMSALLVDAVVIPAVVVRFIADDGPPFVRNSVVLLFNTESATAASSCNCNNPSSVSKSSCICLFNALSSSEPIESGEESTDGPGDRRARILLLFIRSRCGVVGDSIRLSLEVDGRMIGDVFVGSARRRRSLSMICRCRSSSALEGDHVEGSSSVFKYDSGSLVNPLFVVS